MCVVVHVNMVCVCLVAQHGMRRLWRLPWVGECKYCNMSSFALASPRESLYAITSTIGYVPTARNIVAAHFEPFSVIVAFALVFIALLGSRQVMMISVHLSVYIYI